jgi:uncharacterized membrane protein YidH (DUF202 family)
VSAPRDRGAQPERTGLAWERTAAAMGTAAVVVGRLAAERLGVAALFLAGAGLAGSVVLVLRGRRRGHRFTGALLGDGGAPGGVAVLGAAAVVALLAVLEVTGLLLAATSGH